MKHVKPRDKSPMTWLAVTVLLLLVIIAALWVPLYARDTPKLGAFPFFYWYQLVLVPVVAIASWVSYLMLRPSRSKEPPSDPTLPGDPSYLGPEDAR
jgi:membrane protein implicated in regulation of membrane protease activity